MCTFNLYDLLMWYVLNDGTVLVGILSGRKSERFRGFVLVEIVRRGAVVVGALLLLVLLMGGCAGSGG